MPEDPLSEQKRLVAQLSASRQDLRLATTAGGIGIWDYDLNRGTTRWNDQLYRLVGLTPRTGVEDSEVFFAFIHPEDRQGFLEGARAVVRAGPELDLEFRIVRADDGQVRWLAARGKVEYDDRGEPVRIRGANWDITAHKRSEAELAERQNELTKKIEELEHTNQELEAYAHAVSHDLKGPLRAVRNYADFLYEDLSATLSGEQKTYLEGLKAAVDQGAALIDDLLVFARIGRQALEIEPLSIPELVDECRLLLGVAEDVTLRVQPDWPAVSGDRMLVKQILYNLISNGFKFNTQSPKEVAVGWLPPSGGGIEIFIRDNGIGIERRYHKRVFRVFQRLHTNQQYAGTGIGLAIVRKAARKLNGAVRLESAPGRGSTFYVRLPLPPREKRDSPDFREIVEVPEMDP